MQINIYEFWGIFFSGFTCGVLTCEYAIPMMIRRSRAFKLEKSLEAQDQPSDIIRKYQQHEYGTIFPEATPPHGAGFYNTDTNKCYKYNAKTKTWEDLDERQ